MRIVQVANFVAPASGGLRTTLGHLAEGYARAGHEVVQVVPGAEASREEQPWGERHTVAGPRLGGTGYRVISRPGRVRALLDELRPDRLEVHDRTTLRGLGDWSHRHGVRSLVVGHERADRLVAEWLPAPARGLVPLRPFTDRHARALAAGFDGVVSTTAWAAEEFRRVGADNLTLVPLGVDLETFHPRFCDPELRRELLQDNESVLLVHAARLSPEKRPDLAVATVAELVRRGVRARLVVAGTGVSRPALEAAAAGLPVTFLGFVAGRARLASLLATADVVLAPGPVETFGLAALEALACGTPIVVNRGSALREMVVPSCGVAAAGSGWTFADGVQQLLAVQPALRRGTARSRAGCYPWSATVDGFLAAHRLPPVGPQRPQRRDQLPVPA